MYVCMYTSLSLYIYIHTCNLNVSRTQGVRTLAEEIQQFPTRASKAPRVRDRRGNEYNTN